MKILFGIIIFIIFLIIGILIAGVILSSTFGISLPGSGKSGAGDGGVLFSSDRGEYWESRNTVEEKGASISRSSVLDFVFDPQTPDTMYLGVGGGGLFKSVNAGTTWKRMVDRNGFLHSRTSVFRIVVHPSSSNILYVAEEGRVLKSDDGGESFREVYVVAKPKTTVWTVALDIYEPDTVYAGTSDGLLLQSKDGGKFWQTLKQFSHGINAIVVQPSDTRVMYVTLPKFGVFKTTDKGASWQDLTPKIKSFAGALNMTVLLVDPQSHATLYLASDFGLLRTANGGETFEEVKTIIPTRSLPVLSLAIDPVTPTTLYLTARNQLYTSLDRGTSWNVKTLSTTRNLQTLKIHPQDFAKLYIGTAKSGK